jgi:hypothetical protein
VNCWFIEVVALRGLVITGAAPVGASLMVDVALSASLAGALSKSIAACKQAMNPSFGSIFICCWYT